MLFRVVHGVKIFDPIDHANELICLHFDGPKQGIKEKLYVTNGQDIKGSLNVCVFVFPFEVWMDRESADLAVRTLKSLSCRCLPERISCQQVVYLQL